jgi:hypothetical protein
LQINKIKDNILEAPKKIQKGYCNTLGKGIGSKKFMCFRAFLEK